MNEDVFNLETRKLLKKVGITYQREIEKAVREGLGGGKLKGNETLNATVTLQLAELGVEYTIEGQIALDE